MSEYELTDLVGFLKSHESDVSEETKERKLNSLALVSKSKKQVITSSSEDNSSVNGISSSSDDSDGEFNED